MQRSRIDVRGAALLGSLFRWLCALRSREPVLLFPSSGRFPFSLAELVPVVAFCVTRLAATWRLEQGKPLAGFFALYLFAVLVSFAVPSTLGENVGRLRYLALPVALLVCALRFWGRAV